MKPRDYWRGWILIGAWWTGVLAWMTLSVIVRLDKIIALLESR